MYASTQPPPHHHLSRPQEWRAKAEEGAARFDEEAGALRRALQAAEAETRRLEGEAEVSTWMDWDWY